MVAYETPSGGMGIPCRQNFLKNLRSDLHEMIVRYDRMIV